MFEDRGARFGGSEMVLSTISLLPASSTLAYTQPSFPACLVLPDAAKNSFPLHFSGQRRVLGLLWKVWKTKWAFKWDSSAWQGVGRSWGQPVREVVRRLKLLICLLYRPFTGLLMYLQPYATGMAKKALQTRNTSGRQQDLADTQHNGMANKALQTHNTGYIRCPPARIHGKPESVDTHLHCRSKQGNELVHEACHLVDLEGQQPVAHQQVWYVQVTLRGYKSWNHSAFNEGALQLAHPSKGQQQM